MGRSVACVAAIAALLVAPPGGVAAQATYAGVSASNPTGSAGISDSALVLSFDMETRRADGLLRDFGPVGNHGDFRGTRRSEGAFG